MPPKIVISASRRTDIPAFYMDWFMAGIVKGFFEAENPYNRRTRTIPSTTEDVHSIVFWSKDFSGFLENGFGLRLSRMGYRLFFHFTINSTKSVLEPNIPAMTLRLKTLRRLCLEFSPAAVTWRFDPICHFTEKGRPDDNLNEFLHIADAAAGCGVTRCITSFMDPYEKIARRTAKIRGFGFTDPPDERRIEILLHMEKELATRNIGLFLCCEAQVIPFLPSASTIRTGSCIDHALLEKLFGPGLSGEKDLGQRIKQGCGCMTAKDVGSYFLHPCRHHCLYCYANR
jgi:hypothetical protein